MESGTSFCLIVYFLVCSSEAQTNIGAEEIKAEVGKNVTLPCKVPNNNNITAVEWIRPDQDPKYVLFNRDGHLDPHNQHPSYQNRVDLNEEKMKGGNVSLILKDVMKNDTGRYECWVFEEGKKELISIINLEVHLSGKKVGITGGGGEKNGVSEENLVVESVTVLLPAVVSVVFFNLI